MKKYRNGIIAGVFVAVFMAIVFWYGGNAPSLRGWSPESVHNSIAEEKSPEKIMSETDFHENNGKNEKEEQITESDTDKEEKESAEVSEKDIPDTEKKTTESTEKNDELKQPEPDAEKKETAAAVSPEHFDTPKQVECISDEDKLCEEPKNNAMNSEEGEEVGQDSIKEIVKENPLPSDAENVTVTDKEHTCTLTVRCDTIINNIEWLDEGKAELVPENGIILAEKTVTFYEGESVFNLLVREMKRNKIHMEFENTPIYKSAYIEGIANLYEFDCGELSGWMYKVNDWFPNYGCSRYELKEGDRVEWLYTCDLGADIGGNYSARNGR